MSKRSSPVASSPTFPFDKFDYKYLAANLKYHRLEGKSIQFMNKEEIDTLVEAVWYSFPEVTRELCVGRIEPVLPVRTLEKEKP